MESVNLGGQNRLVFFGCPLDCDEREAAVMEKIGSLGAAPAETDPYEMLMQLVRAELAPDLWEERGSLEVPAWCLPVPSLDQRENLSVAGAVRFTDQDGCRLAADMVAEAAAAICPAVPCLIGVDHSLTGGAYRALAEHYAPEEITLVVLDSHTDALPLPVLADTIAYDLDTNPQTRYTAGDPFLHDRPDSYNASSFLHHLLRDGIIKPSNLFILGVGDYPPKKAFRIKDSRIRRYTGVFENLRRQGVRLITKADLLCGSSRLQALLKSIQTPYIYVSIDMDIGAGNALEAVRFTDRQGLSENRIYALAKAIRGRIENGVRLAGMDILEINPRRLRGRAAAKSDRTLQVAWNLIKILCCGVRRSAAGPGLV